MGNETISINDDLAKAIQESINSTDIRTVVQAELDKQSAASAALATSQAAAEKAAADKIAADALAAAPSAFSRVETIGGREFTFEAGSELELERLVNNAYKIAFAVQTPEEPVAAVPVVDAAAVAAAAAAEAEAKAELELKFKRGEISTADYLEQSGAVKDYLQKQGVPLEALKAAVDKNQDNQFEQSWAQATEQFKNSAAGSSWPGGEQNKNMIGLLIAQLGLIDAKDKVAALAQAYEQMKSTGMIFPGDAAEKTATSEVVVDPAAPAAPIVAPAAVVAPPAAPVAPRAPSVSSSVFGASSGVSGGSGAAAPAAAAKVDVDPNASPAEIIDAWKKAQVAGGKDPNAAFVDTFASRRA